MMFQKRGQLTIFIIVAVLVVALVILVFFVSPGLRRGGEIGRIENPENFIQTCLEDSIKEKAETIGLQGGSFNPEFYYLYQDNKLQYLCYNNDVYALCAVQQPFLREHVENEIKEGILEDVNFCFNSLKDNYPESNVVKGIVKVNLLPEKILTTMNYEFTFSVAGQTERREKFDVVLNNNLYELVAIAQHIVEFEALFGEADADRYMDLYSDLKVEKYPQTDETYIYILTNKETGDKFQFASRSLAFSPSD